MPAEPSGPGATPSRRQGDVAPVRAAIIGLGWWGRIMVEAQAGPGRALRFVQGFARHPAPIREFAVAHGLLLAQSFEAILADPGIDAVVLATPHSLHVEQIIAAARAGKHVFCEKPLALSGIEALRAVSACEAAGIVLGLGTDRRMLPAIKRLKSISQSGALGEILQVEAQYSNDNMSRKVSGDWRQTAEETPGGGLTGPGLHALDGIVDLLGPLAHISGQLLRPRGAEVPIDALSLMGQAVGGAGFLLGTVRGAPNYHRLAVYGSEGWAEARHFGLFEAHIRAQSRIQEVYSGAFVVGDLLEAFAAAVRGRAPFPVTIPSMLASVAAFEAALAAFETPGPHAIPLLRGF